MLRTCSALLKNVTTKAVSVRTMTHYPIDDAMFGLNEDQTAVSEKFVAFVIYFLLIV